jgi:phage gp16-like protein
MATQPETARARPAQFDRASQHRRAMLAKVHIARKTLAMDEDDYRQGLLANTGKMSASDCTDAELATVLAWLQSKGWRPLPKAGGRPMAQHPVARKARALWISLYHLGVVHNPSEPALETFARKQTGCETLAWMRQSQGDKLIEALKAMAERAGWRQRGMDGKPLHPIVLNSHLCELILARLRELGVAPDGWSLETAAFRLCGIELCQTERMFGAEEMQRLAAALGRKLREAAPHAATAEEDAK